MAQMVKNLPTIREVPGSIPRSGRYPGGGIGWLPTPVFLHGEVHGQRSLADYISPTFKDFPGGSDGKESPCNAGDPGSIPELERCPGEGNGYWLQDSCLENPMDRGAWWATGSIPELERCPGEGNGYPLQDSCLENPMDRGAWWATVHGVAKSWTQLSN